MGVSLFGAAAVMACGIGESHEKESRGALFVLLTNVQLAGPSMVAAFAIACTKRRDILRESDWLCSCHPRPHDGILAPIHRAQAINYLKLTGLSVALLINFNVPVLKQGVRRLVHPQFYGKDSDLFTP